MRHNCSWARKRLASCTLKQPTSLYDQYISELIKEHVAKSLRPALQKVLIRWQSSLQSDTLQCKHGSPGMEAATHAGCGKQGSVALPMPVCDLTAVHAHDGAVVQARALLLSWLLHMPGLLTPTQLASSSAGKHHHGHC